MTEILTESFCERCGTRYTFESAAPRTSRIGRVRMLGKGVRNFVLSDDASFSEAMADARSEVEINATALQLDAFHQTFNFCLTCRQYTCGNCWNAVEGRCLTCAPAPEMELPAVGAAAVMVADVAFTEPANGHAHDDEAWPDADLSSARLARALGMDEAEVEAVEQADAQSDGLEQGDVAVVATGEQPVTTNLIGIAPGQSLEDAIAEYEARIEADEAADELAVSIARDAAEIGAAAEPEPEVIAELIEAAAEPEPEVIAEPIEADAAPEPEPEVIAEPIEATAAPEPEPEVIAEPIEADEDPLAAALAAAALAAVEDEPALAEDEPAIVADAPLSAAEPGPEAHPVAAEAPRDDVVPQPAWPVAAAPDAPDAPAAPVPQPVQGPAPAPWLTVAPEETDREPQWPVAPSWPVATNRRDVPTTLAGRPLLPQADPSGLWAASAREVLTGTARPVAPEVAAPAPSAQPCVSCGLSLSANARFCRRCGSRQG